MGEERRYGGHLHAQSIKIAHLSEWRSGYFQDTLAGVPIILFAFRPALDRFEIVVDGPDKCCPLQALV